MMHQGRAPWMEKDTLHNILTIYRELRDRDWIFTLNLLAAEMKRLYRSVQGLSLAATRYHMWCDIKKHGGVWRRVTHVAQNMRYDQIIIQGWVPYVSNTIKIVNIDNQHRI
jgi:hypothetical protein